MNPVVLRYQLGPSEFLVKGALINGDSWRQGQLDVWKNTLFIVVLCVLGLFAAHLADNHVLLIIFGASLLARLTVPFEYKNNFKARLVRLAEKRIRRRNVSLTISDEGLLEEIEGISSIAPWHTVKSLSKSDHVLLLELSGDVWLLIPEVAFLGAEALTEAEFMTILKTKGISERCSDLRFDGDIKERI